MQFSLWHRSVLVLIHNQIVSKYEKQLALKTGNSYLSCSNSPRGSTENQEIPNLLAAELSLCAFGICNLKFFYAT